VNRVLTFRTSLALAIFTALAVPPVFGTTTHPASTSKHAPHTTQPHTTQAHATQTHGAQATHGTRKGKSRERRPRGQQVIAPDRVTEIQQALIREHYLSGEADGQWDERTKGAMQKYQSDQGWQTKLTPDARALKKLGLGPDYSNAINAKNSSFAEPPPASTIPPTVAAGFATAAGVK
jgi:peptidoglycan hydrolase-like protein with peptidoglycan-binding domain